MTEPSQTTVPRSGELFLQSADATICAETFGSADDPAVLLIGGAAASMDWWEDEFCARLADSGRYVIRYDNRDVPASTRRGARARDPRRPPGRAGRRRARVPAACDLGRRHPRDHRNHSDHLTLMAAPIAGNDPLKAEVKGATT